MTQLLRVNAIVSRGRQQQGTSQTRTRCAIPTQVPLILHIWLTPDGLHSLHALVHVGDYTDNHPIEIPDQYLLRHIQRLDRLNRMDLEYECYVMSCRFHFLASGFFVAAVTRINARHSRGSKGLRLQCSSRLELCKVSTFRV
jgi:hypothetical protein